MGQVRARKFDAVISVGGLSAEPQACGIAGRITWVGACRSESIPVGYRGPIVEFDRFKLFDEAGPKLDSLAPALAHHLFAIHRRVIMSDGLNDTIQREITKILALAMAPGRTTLEAAAPRPKRAPARVKSGICFPRKRHRIC
jgi:hypothetical protein